MSTFNNLAACRARENNAAHRENDGESGAQIIEVDKNRKILTGNSMMVEDFSCIHFESRWRVPEIMDSAENGFDPPLPALVM